MIKFEFTKNPFKSPVSPTSWIYFTTSTGEIVTPDRIDGLDIYLPEFYLGSSLIWKVVPTVIPTTTNANLAVSNLQNMLDVVEGSAIAEPIIPVSGLPGFIYCPFKVVFSDTVLSYTDTVSSLEEFSASEWAPFHKAFMLSTEDLLIYDTENIQRRSNRIVNGVYVYNRILAKSMTCITQA